MLPLRDLTSTDSLTVLRFVRVTLLFQAPSGMHISQGDHVSIRHAKDGHLQKAQAAKSTHWPSVVVSA